MVETKLDVARKFGGFEKQLGDCNMLIMFWEIKFKFYALTDANYEILKIFP